MVSVVTSSRARTFRRAAEQFAQAFGDRLRRLRLAAGRSQADCAERCGIAPRSVSRYETGATLPSASVVLLLAAGIDVEPAALLGISGQGS